MATKNYILGGGINGIIAAHFMRDYTVISPDIGGQMSVSWAGPRLLHTHSNNEKLLNSVSYGSFAAKTYKIVYYYCEKTKGNLWHDTIDAENKLTYWLKSRCLDSDSDSELVPAASSMSDGNNTLQAFDIDWARLISLLAESMSSRWIKAKVTNIDTENKVIHVENGNKIKYDQILSTIPAPLLFKLTNQKTSQLFEAKPKVFMKVPNSSQFSRILPTIPEGCDYAYIVKTPPAYHRLTKFENCVIVEFTGEEFIEIVEALATRHSFEQFVQPNAQIIPTKEKIEHPKDITPLGRYAEWNHGLKIQDVVGWCLANNS